MALLAMPSKTPRGESPPPKNGGSNWQSRQHTLKSGLVTHQKDFGCSFSALRPCSRSGARRGAKQDKTRYDVTLHEPMRYDVTLHVTLSPEPCALAAFDLDEFGHIPSSAARAFRPAMQKFHGSVPNRTELALGLALKWTLCGTQDGGV